MPIRMVDDPNDQQDNSNDNSGGSGGGGGFGGGGLLQFLPLILGFLIRKPLLLVVVLAIGAFVYFKGGFRSSAGNNGSSPFGLGGTLDPKEFAKANVYEGLDPAKTDLPEAVSLLKFAPDRKNQGQQGSCVAWSSTYGARTILQASSTGQDPNSVAFSPSFIYNQIGEQGCDGSLIIKAMQTLTQEGAVPFNQFPYDENDCSRQPDNALKQEAGQFKMLGFTRLTPDEGTNNIDLHAIKEHLSKDVPVVIGMMVGGSFMQGMMGQEVWHPTQDDYSEQGFGGHALCVIGYDDRKEGGAFQIMNSWGSDWGQNGICWVKYDDFKHFVQEAYGLNPLPKTGSAAEKDLDCSIGLVEAKTKQYIPLQLSNGNSFSTKSAIAKGTQFKIEVKNNISCYIYVFGMDTDGSSYVLFPYPTKADPTKTMFSPYCGITGYRLFPRGMSLMADSIGSKDQMAVVVSKQPLDVFAVNQSINQNKSSDYAGAVNAALSGKIIPGVQFGSTGNGAIQFKTPGTESANIVAAVVSIDKR